MSLNNEAEHTAATQPLPASLLPVVVSPASAGTNALPQFLYFAGCNTLLR